MNQQNSNTLVKQISRMLPRYLFAALFLFGGVNHFLNQEFYLKMMPDYIPAHVLMVQVSGIAEVCLGLLLLVPLTSRFAAWGLIALLIAVFPANVYMAMNPSRFPEMPQLGLWVRLPIQGLLVWWAYRYTRSGVARG